jgi:hypothetical protein
METLRFGEAAPLGGGEFDVALDGSGKVAGAALDLLGRDHDLAFPLVQFARVVAHRGLTARADLGKHLVDDAARLGDVGLRHLSPALRYSIYSP